MTENELLAEMAVGFENRKFSAGLLIALADFFLNVSCGDKFDTFESFLGAYPQEEKTKAGTKANTLIVRRSDGTTVSIRPFYNAVERAIRQKHHRYDYPSCAPHATQAWRDYTTWLDTLAAMSDVERESVRERALQFVLSNLPDQSFDPSNARSEPPIFKYVLDGFNLGKQVGEKTGAAYQGIVFGFLRADNPHLQVEVRKVRTGSARQRGIGDIDCWDGGALAISAEVKQYAVQPKDVADFHSFADEVNRRGALGIVVALEFTEDRVRDALEKLGIRALDRSDLLGIVELWDPLKQRTAVSALNYYVDHVEQNSSLKTRLETYIDEQLGGKL